MNLLAVVFAACLAAVPACAQDAGPDHWDARLAAVSGDVVVHPAGGGADAAAEKGVPLEEGDRVTTSSGSTAEISLDGGSLIALRENTDFTLENTRKSDSVFSLSLGSILAKIEKLGEQSLSVRSPTSVAAVRGTEFGVDVEGGGSHVGVFDEGRVEVRGDSGGTEVLTPNQETSVARGEAPLKAAPLKRFAARREMMRAHVARLAAVRKNWKPMKAAARREARAQALKRARARGARSRDQGAAHRRARGARPRATRPPAAKPKRRAPRRGRAREREEERRRRH